MSNASKHFATLFGISYFIATVGVPANSYFGNSSKKKFDIVGACANNCPMVPAQNILLPIAMPLGSLVVVAVSLTYFVSKKGKHVPTDQVAFMPSGIVAAMYV